MTLKMLLRLTVNPGIKKRSLPLETKESIRRQPREQAIGLFGFGCAGQGLYNVLKSTGTINAGIKKICIKDIRKKRNVSPALFTPEKEDLLRNGRYDIIVELINDSNDAFEIAERSLRKGKAVISANKKMIAENFKALYGIISAAGTPLLYEGACGGSIPIIRVLEEYYGNEEINVIRGIVNGSSNYVLSKMEDGNLPYKDALRDAAAAGFAERDPAFDVKGYDSKFKLCILAVHAFGVIFEPREILNLGIENISRSDLLYAQERNLKIKLISYIEKREGRLIAYVLPHFIPAGDELGNIHNENNGIEVRGVFSGRQFYSGKGAGSLPTGCAVLSDVWAASLNYRYKYTKLKDNRGKECRIHNEHEIKVYIRYENPGSLEALDIKEVEETGKNFIIYRVSIESLFKLQSTGNKLFVCAF